MSIDNVENVEPRVQYVALAAQTAFTYPFPIFADGDLVVDVDGVTQALSTDYAVSGAGDDTGGTVTFLSALDGDEIVTIYRDIPIERTSDFQTNGPLRSATFNDELDKLTMILQQLEANIGRSLRIPVTGEATSTETEFSPIANWLSKYVFINAQGVPEPAAIVTGTISQSVIAALLQPQTATELAAGVTPTNFQYAEGDVRRYGAAGDGTTDDTVAFTRAIAVAEEKTNGGAVYAPAGDYKVTSTLAISGNRIHVRGDGRSATRIVFAPTANDVLFEFHAGASAIVRCSLKSMALYSDDSTFTKTAIDLYDTEEFELEDVEIGGSVAVSSVAYWSGSNSIGLRTRGRQAAMIGKVQIAADRPILISVNPNSTIDIDHFNFNNLYLLANAHPVVEIESGVELTNVFFDGFQSWVKGTHGLYWLDTTSVGQSAFLELKNVRWEQGTSAGSYLVRIEHNTALTGLKIVNCRGGGDALTRNGYYLRKVSNVMWDTTLYEGTGTALDADSTCRALKGVNTFWQTASTATLVGQKLIRGSPLNPSGGLRPNFEYDTDANTDETSILNGAVCGTTVSIAQDATHTIGTTALQGILLVTTNENTSAIYALKGSSAATAEISDPDGFFTNAAGGASAYNIYATGGNYVIQNKRTGTHKVRYLLIGAHTVAD